MEELWYSCCFATLLSSGLGRGRLDGRMGGLSQFEVMVIMDYGVHSELDIETRHSSIRILGVPNLACCLLPSQALGTVASQAP